MFILLKNILFFGTLWFFGWQFSGYFLKERRKLFLGILGLSLGVSFYVFLANLLSYSIKPPLSFFLAFGLLLILGLGLFLYQQKKGKNIDSGFFQKQIKTVVITALIIGLISGFIALRTLERDDFMPSHIPLASLLSQGNFPPKDPVGPIGILAYHYAPDLFSATLYSLTGVSLWLAYDIQTALFTSLIFLLGFIFIYQLFKIYKIALFGALGLLYAGSLNYLLTFPFFGVLYKKFILNYPIAHPFKLVADISEGEITKSLINQVHYHTPSFGFLLTLIVLYLFWQFYQKKLSGVSFGLIGGILFGFLALSQETTFVILFFAFFLLFLILLTKEKKFSLGFFFFLIIGAGLSLIQGGVLSHLEIFLPTFSLTPELVRGGETATIVNTPGLEFTFWEFLKDFGLPLFLFLPALIFLRKKLPWPLLFIFIFIIFASILTPFFIHYLYSRELLKFFHLASAFLALMASIYLTWLFFEIKQPIWKKRLISLVFFLMILNGLTFQLIYLIFPLGNISRQPQKLFAAYPDEPITFLEKKAKEWLHKNTTINDWFFAVDLATKPYTSINHRLVVLFGRFAPAWHYTIDSPVKSEEAVVYKRLVSNCLAEDLNILKYRYIFVNNLWPKDLEERCLENNNLTLVYQDYEQDDFIRIYQIDL